MIKKKSTVSPKGFKLSRKNSHCGAGDRILGSSFIVHIYERKNRVNLVSKQLSEECRFVTVVRVRQDLSDLLCCGIGG